MAIESKSVRTKTMLLCLLAATLIWFMNKLNKDGYVVQVKYPLQITYNDSVYIPIRPLPKNVMAQISGNGWTLLRKSLSLAVTPVVCHLPNPLNANLISTNYLAMQMNEQIKDVKINHILPDTNQIGFERRVQKKCLLKVDSMNVDIQPHFAISSLINLTPNTVIFDGPSSTVSKLRDTIWIKIPAKRIRNNFDESLNIDYPHSPLVKASTEKVFVSFEVAELLSPVNK